MVERSAESLKRVQDSCQNSRNRVLLQNQITWDRDPKWLSNSDHLIVPWPVFRITKDSVTSLTEHGPMCDLNKMWQQSGVKKKVEDSVTVSDGLLFFTWWPMKLTFFFMSCNPWNYQVVCLDFYPQTVYQLPEMSKQHKCNFSVLPIMQNYGSISIMDRFEFWCTD